MEFESLIRNIFIKKKKKKKTLITNRANKLFGLIAITDGKSKSVMYEMIINE